MSCRKWIKYYLLRFELTSFKLIIAAIILVAIVAVVFPWNVFFPSGLKLENITPNPLKMTSQETKNINFNIISNENKTFDNIRIVPTIEHNSGNYIQTIPEFKYEKPVEGKGGTSDKPLGIPITALNSVGSTMKYHVRLQLYANNTLDVRDNQTVNVIIASNLFDSVQRPLTYPQKIQFVSFDTKNVTINEGDSASVSFKITNNEESAFSSIYVKPDIENGFGYLKIDDKQISDISGKGYTVGTQSMPIQSIKSNGYEMDYLVHFDLYANGLLMDSKPVYVTVLSK